MLVHGPSNIWTHASSMPMEMFALELSGGKTSGRENGDGDGVAVPAGTVLPWAMLLVSSLSGLSPLAAGLPAPPALMKVKLAAASADVTSTILRGLMICVFIFFGQGQLPFSSQGLGAPVEWDAAWEWASLWGQYIRSSAPAGCCSPECRSALWWQSPTRLPARASQSWLLDYRAIAGRRLPSAANSTCIARRRRPAGWRLQLEKSRLPAPPKRWYHKNDAARWRHWEWLAPPGLPRPMPEMCLRPSRPEGHAAQWLAACCQVSGTCSG